MIDTQTGYLPDLSRITLGAFRHELETGRLLPGRRPLLDEIDARFGALERAGLGTLADVKAALSTTRKLLDVAARTGISADYLKLLRREINSVMPAPVAFRDVPNIADSTLAALDAAGVSDTADLFARVRNAQSRAAFSLQTGLSGDETVWLAKLVDVSRIKWTGPKLARLIVDSEYDTVAKLAAADPAAALAAFKRVKAQHKAYDGSLGIDDIELWIRQIVRKLPLVIDFDEGEFERASRLNRFAGLSLCYGISSRATSMPGRTYGVLAWPDDVSDCPQDEGQHGDPDGELERRNCPATGTAAPSAAGFLVDPARHRTEAAPEIKAAALRVFGVVGFDRTWKCTHRGSPLGVVLHLSHGKPMRPVNGGDDDNLVRRDGGRRLAEADARGLVAQLGRLDAQGALAQDDEDARAHHDEAAEQRLAGDDIAKDPHADEDGKNQRSVFKRRDHRHVGIAEALGQQHLGDAAEGTGKDQHQRLFRRRHDPAEGDGEQRKAGAGDREIERDGGRAFGLGQVLDGKAGQRGEQRPCQRRQSAKAGTVQGFHAVRQQGQARRNDDGDPGESEAAPRSSDRAAPSP